MCWIKYTIKIEEISKVDPEAYFTYTNSNGVDIDKNSGTIILKGSLLPLLALLRDPREAVLGAQLAIELIHEIARFFPDPNYTHETN